MVEADQLNESVPDLELAEEGACEWRTRRQRRKDVANPEIR